MFGLSLLGTFHTLISLVAIFAAASLFIRSGRIDPKGLSGRTYMIATALGCVTAFGLSKHGGFNPGHALAIITLLCLGGAIFAEKRKIRGWRYVEVTLLSLSLFFSLIPATNETLTRLPLNSPLAKGPEDPLVIHSLAVLALLFVTTLLLQIYFLRKQSVHPVNDALG